MGAAITSLADQGGYGFLNSVADERLVIRVKWDNDAAYSSTTGVGADTDLNVNLRGLTVSQLKDTVQSAGNYSMAQSRAIYRKARLPAGAAYSIPLFKTTKTVILTGIGLITTSLADAGATDNPTISVGTAGANGSILGGQTLSSLVITSPNTSALWQAKFPYDSANPTLSLVGDALAFYSPDKVLPPGVIVSLYVGAHTTDAVTAGDITFEFIAASYGLESLGVTESIATIGVSQHARKTQPIVQVF